MSGRGTRTIKVDTLARVEGEGELFIKMAGDRISDVKLRVYEPPRMFEAFLRNVMNDDLSGFESAMSLRERSPAASVGVDA